MSVSEQPMKRKIPSEGSGQSSANKKTRLTDGPAPPQTVVVTPAIPMGTSAPPRPDLILRIPSSSLALVHEVDAAVGASQLVNGAWHLDVLAGDALDLSVFASKCGGTSWLQVLAHNIFDPIEQRGRLWTHLLGTTEEWRGRFRNDTEWGCVPLSTPLQSAIYEYVMPPNLQVTVPRICTRQSLSATSLGQENRRSSEAFRHALMERDQNRCMITQTRDPKKLTPSHIIPRRLSGAVAAIAARHVRIAQQRPIDDGWDPRIGCMVDSHLEVDFDVFDMGLFRDPSNPEAIYYVHIFDADNLMAGLTGRAYESVEYPGSLANDPSDPYKSDYSFSAQSTPPALSPGSGPASSSLPSNSRPNKSVLDAVENEQGGHEQNSQTPGPASSSPLSSPPSMSVMDAVEKKQGGHEQNSQTAGAASSSPLAARPSTSTMDTTESEQGGREQTSQTTGVVHKGSSQQVQDIENEEDVGVNTDKDDGKYKDAAPPTFPLHFPPAGIFAWHYTQGILKRYATPQLRGLEQVLFLEKPSRHRGDSDDESDWESSPAPARREALYPTHGFEMYLARAALAREVNDWASQIPKVGTHGSSAM